MGTPVSAFSEVDFAEAKAYEGKFVVNNLRPGTYIGIVTGKSGICGITEVSISTDHVQEITLAGNK